MIFCNIFTCIFLNLSHNLKYIICLFLKCCIYHVSTHQYYLYASQFMDTVSYHILTIMAITFLWNYLFEYVFNHFGFLGVELEIDRTISHFYRNYGMFSKWLHNHISESSKLQPLPFCQPLLFFDADDNDEAH